MPGFFSKKETELSSRPDGKTYSCVACGLHRRCKSPKMEAFGNFKKGILNIGEAPGETEDRIGKPWQGKMGALLKKRYESLGIDLFEDCLNINAVRCRPTEDDSNRAPSNYEIECCRRPILEVITERKPKLIILLGNSAVYSVIGHKWQRDLGGIMKWRGFTIPDQGFNVWICPTFHPSYVERAESLDVETIWKQDLLRAFNLIGSDPSPFPYYVEPKIEIIEDLSVLRKIPDGQVIAFDYETTGLKPHAANHRIVCVSIATGPNHVYVFMMPNTPRERRPFIELLANPKIGKMAHNMKFEEAWSVNRLRQPVQNWVWDSMLAAHLLDNRPGITGLKFQSFINFGISDYSTEISSFLQSDDDGNGNALNRVQELIERPGGAAKLMHYCALDSIYEYRLALKQQSEIILPF